jgi:beta-lactam-binding protein with PASTA domain
MSDAGADPGTDVVPTDEPDNEAQSRRRIAFLIVAVAVAIIIWWIISHIAVVPSTVGMSAGRAGGLLKFAGFETSVTLVPCEDQLSGRVLVQAPARGLYLTWWPVRVMVGASGLAGGPDENNVSFVIVPGSGALDLPAPAAAQEVMPTDPEEVLPLYYPPVTWEKLMPDVQNMTKSQAIAALDRVGMSATTKSGPSTTDVSKGRVYHQKPAPGVGVTSGQTAVLWFSDGSFSVLSGKYTGFPYPRPPYQYGE